MKTNGLFPKRERINRIDPFVDWGFKDLFGREENKDLLIGFINFLLEPDLQIKDLKYVNTELLADNPNVKRCVVDVLATDEDDNRYLIEMQNVYDPDIRQRLVYYASRLVDQMSQHNQDWTYGQIKKVFAICLMNFNYETEDPELRCDYQFRGPNGKKVLSDIVTIIPLQIPCIRAKSPSEFRKSYEVLLALLKSLSEQMKTKDDLLAEIDGMTAFPEETRALFRKIVNTSSRDLSGEELRQYELRREAVRRAMSEYRGAKEMGIEEGLAKGREEGLKEGREEMRLETAKALKTKGVDFEIISACTGLSVEDIQKL